MDSPPRIRFNKPPVIEVVVGIAFRELAEFKVPHVGLFWGLVRGDFPVVEERPPIESNVFSSGNESLELKVSFAPSMPRVWLVSADGRSLLQIQRDRFLYNWKRVDQEDNYPSYDEVIAKFENYFSLFSRFIREQKLGDIANSHYELTYVNHITQENGLNVIDRSEILRDHTRISEKGRFLPAPEAFVYRDVFNLPDDIGKLTLAANSAIRNADKSKIVRLDFIARGFPDEKLKMSARAWFDAAHAWITHGFADATARTLHAQEMWDRKS